MHQLQYEPAKRCRYLWHDPENEQWRIRLWWLKENNQQTCTQASFLQRWEDWENSLKLWSCSALSKHSVFRLPWGLLRVLWMATIQRRFDHLRQRGEHPIVIRRNQGFRSTCQKWVELSSENTRNLFRIARFHFRTRCRTWSFRTFCPTWCKRWLYVR